MQYLHIAIAICLSQVLAQVSPGQAAPEVEPSPPAAAAGQPPTTMPELSPADREFEPIALAIQNMHGSLRTKRSMSASDRRVVESLRGSARAFTAKYPDDIRGFAADLQLSMWLNDDAAVDALLETMQTRWPDQAHVKLMRAKRLRAKGRYGEALEELAKCRDNAAFIAERRAEVNALMAEALLIEHRFVEAIPLLQTLTPQEVSSSPLLRESLQSWTAYASSWEQEQSIRRAEEHADDLPRAMIVTSRGPIVVELFENEAPNTVANFVALAEQGFYSDTLFHHAEPHVMVRGGDPNSKAGVAGPVGMGHPGYFLPDEQFRPDHRQHFTGSVGLWNLGRANSGGSQFYITRAPTPGLNGKYTVFGRVLEGMDVVYSLVPNDAIKSITILRKREHEYNPMTLPAPAVESDKPGFESAPPPQKPALPPGPDSAAESRPRR